MRSEGSKMWLLAIGIVVAQIAFSFLLSILCNGSFQSAWVGWLVQAPGIIVAGWLAWTGRSMRTTMSFAGAALLLAVGVALGSPSGTFTHEPALLYAISSIAVSGLTIPILFGVNNLFILAVRQRFDTHTASVKKKFH